MKEKEKTRENMNEKSRVISNIYINHKGITLVALVITIIILLILAGIAISLTLGQRGILKYAENAGKNYQNATVYENEVLSIINDEIGNIASNTNRAEDRLERIYN